MVFLFPSSQADLTFPAASVILNLQCHLRHSALRGFVDCRWHLFFIKHPNPAYHILSNLPYTRNPTNTAGASHSLGKRLLSFNLIQHIAQHNRLKPKSYSQPPTQTTMFQKADMLPYIIQTAPNMKFNLPHCLAHQSFRHFIKILRIPFSF
jgi:hypothetical protein